MNLPKIAQEIVAEYELRRHIIEIALSQVGEKEYPAGSNKTKYGEWFGLNGVAWCGIFCSWVYAQAQAKMSDPSAYPELILKGLGYSKGFAGCQTAVEVFKKAGKVTDAPKSGDLVFFNFDSDVAYDHVGIYLTNSGGNTMYTIEGNTSLANQTNGGEVMRRERRKEKILFVNAI